MGSSISDFVGVFDGVYTSAYCRQMIDLFEDADRQGFTLSRKQNEVPAAKIKQDDSYIFSSSIPLIHMYSGSWFDFSEPFWGCYREYADQYEHALTSSSDSHNIYVVKMQRTTPGQGYHQWHYESADRKSSTRLLAFTVYLNTIDDGGETEFLYYSRRVKPVEGRVCIFPAGFTHLHRGNPPLSGTKYILTGWVEF